MTSSKISLRGTTFNTLVEGPAEAPWLVLSNSLATNLSLWDSFAASMSDRYRVFRYDQRGHGQTPASPPPYEMAELADDLVALMDHCGIDRAHFVGISMGGVAGWGLARQAPQRLLTLTICDTAMQSGAGADWDARLAVVKSSGLGALVEPTLERWFTKASMAGNNDAVRKVREMIRTTSEDGFVGCVNALKNFNYSEGVESLQMPVLLVAGAEDGTRPKAMADDAARISNASLAIIPDAGHLSNIENPDHFNMAVSSFIDRH